MDVFFLLSIKIVTYLEKDNISGVCVQGQDFRVLVGDMISLFIFFSRILSNFNNHSPAVRP